jgi:hypothetical protein
MVVAVDPVTAADDGLVDRVVVVARGRPTDEPVGGGVEAVADPVGAGRIGGAVDRGVVAHDHVAAGRTAAGPAGARAAAGPCGPAVVRALVALDAVRTVGMAAASLRRTADEVVLPLVAEQRVVAGVAFLVVVGGVAVDRVVAAAAVQLVVRLVA